MTAEIVTEERYPWLWDVEMDNATFMAVLRGETSSAGHDCDWALLRLIEYAPFRDILRLLPLDLFLTRWPMLMGRVRSVTRRAGMDYYVEWAQRGKPTHV